MQASGVWAGIGGPGGCGGHMSARDLREGWVSAGPLELRAGIAGRGRHADRRPRGWKSPWLVTLFEGNGWRSAASSEEPSTDHASASEAWHASYGQRADLFPASAARPAFARHLGRASLASV